MRRRETAAVKAKHLLSQASRGLGTQDPVDDVGDFIDETMAMPIEDLDAGSDRLFEPLFSETTPSNLSFLAAGGGSRLSGGDRIETATEALGNVVGRRFGREALHWLEGRVEPMRTRGHMRTASWGASFGGSYDRNGVTESSAYYEWGPMLMDALPAPLYRIARIAVESVPGLRPILTAIRCGRRSGSQQLSFAIDRTLGLNDLQPLMDRLGLGQRHGSLMSVTAFVLGARFTFPPDTVTLTLRPTRAGVEMRIDVDLDALPDPPAQLMALMRMQMQERPTSAQGLDRWLMALTPDGYPGPGSVSVLSVWVRPDLPARLALYLRPVSLDNRAQPNGSVRRVRHESRTSPSNGGSPVPEPAVANAWAPRY
jgi:hypothetical protein